MLQSIKSVSFIGEPKSNSAMFVSAKVGSLLANLKTVENCLVFAETGLEVSEDLRNSHNFEFTDNPQLAYYHFTKQLSEEIEDENFYRKYRVLENGAKIGENVKIGVDCKIESGAIIDHDSIIGQRVTVGKNSIIQRAILGDDIKIGENTIIGADGYNLVKDESGKLLSMPTLGKVEILEETTINSNCVIVAGLAGVTRIGSNTHIDSQSHIHHDCQIGNNVQLASSVSMGGFTTIKNNSFVGIGSKIKNRVNIGSNVLIGMGSVVIKDISDNSKAYGVPAKVIN